MQNPCLDGNGVVPGMEAAIIDVFSRYVAPPQGIYGLGATVIPTLPWGEWHWFSWMQRAAISLTAGQSTLEVFYTVPEDERNEINSMLITRTGGDNLASSLNMLAPPDYQTGTTEIPLLTLAVASQNLGYPHSGILPDLSRQLWGGPFLIEPGTRFSFGPDGSGIAASTFDAYILMKRSKLIRARAAVSA